MTDARLELEGFRELAAALNELPDTIARRVLVNAVRAGATVIRREARARVPVRTGKLRRSLSVKLDRKEPGRVVYQIGNRRGVAHYAHLIERGYIHRSGRHVPARPFLRPAVEASKQEVLDTIAARIRAGIAREAARLKRG